MEAKELLGAALSSHRLECFIRAGSALQRTFLCTVLILDTWACVPLHVCVRVRLLYVNVHICMCLRVGSCVCVCMNVDIHNANITCVML